MKTYLDLSKHNAMKTYPILT